MSRFAELLGSTDSDGKIVRSELSKTTLRTHSSQAPRRLPQTLETDHFSVALRVLRHRKFTVIGFFLLVVFLVSLASFLMKPKYEAVARIVFNRENANPLGFKTLGDESPQDDEYSVSLDTQLQILQSDTLGLQVIRELHLESNRVFAGPAADKRPTGDGSSSELPARERQELLKIFRDGLSVLKEKNTRVVEIRYKSKDPKLSAEIVNAVTRAYIEHNFKMRFESTMQTSSWLTQQLSELATKVQDSQQKLVDYQKEHGFLQLDDKQNVVTTRLDDLNRELTAAQTDRISKEADLRLTMANNAELTAKAEPNALIDKLNAQEAALKAEYAQVTVLRGPANPKVQELGDQIKETERQIGAELKKMSDRVRTQYYEALARERMVRAAVEEQKEKANQLNESAIEYSLLKRDAESNRQLYEGLLQKLKEAGVSAGLRSSNIHIVDVAQVPAVPAEPNIPLNLLMAAFLGLFGGIALALIQERLDPKVRGPHHIQVLSSFPQLAIIPLRAKVAPGISAGQPLNLNSGKSSADLSVCDLIASSDPTSPSAESYRGLANSVLLSAAVPPKTILVTSAISGEGKTTTSVNLAIILARQGRRVLLVDTDLRRPSIHKVMQVSVEEGLTSLLRRNIESRESDLASASESAIYGNFWIPTLFVMPAGPVDAEPSELLVSDVMQDLLRVWSKQFDHVIIDSPPVLQVSDAVRLSASADSVILVVRSGQTPQEAFARAQDLLRQVNASVMGVVLNAVDLGSSELAQYSQYGYYGASNQLQND